MGTWITLTEAERKSDEEAKAREVRIGQSLKINHDQRCNVQQAASQSQRRPLVAFFHCNGLFKATPNPYKAQDEWARVNCVSFGERRSFRKRMFNVLHNQKLS